jgi:FAD/FMN-containing dehydrogenase
MTPIKPKTDVAVRTGRSSALESPEASTDVKVQPDPNAPVHARDEVGPPRTRAPALPPIERIPAGPNEVVAELTDRVGPMISALVNATTGVPFYRRAWAGLSGKEQAALGRLGYDGARWNAVRDGYLSKASPASLKTFDKLTPDERAAAEELGYDANSWAAEHSVRADILKNRDILSAFESLLDKNPVITEQQVRDVIIPAARDWGVEWPTEKRALLYLIGYHGNRFSEAARWAIRDDVSTNTRADQLAAKIKGTPLSNMGWSESITPQAMGETARQIAKGHATVVNDASGMSPVAMRAVAKVGSFEEIRGILQYAREQGLKVSIAGRRHSEGGQTATPGGIQIDMLKLNRVQVQGKGETVRVECGATWTTVLDELEKHGKTVRIMQASNVFSVGGTASVNAHGRTPGEPPFIDSVKSFRIMLANGEVKTCSREENAELFRNAIGGYGLYGVILDMELYTQDNVNVRMHVEKVSTQEIAARFEQAKADPDTKIAYGRVPPTLKDDGMFVTAKRVPDDEQKSGTDFEQAGHILLERTILEMSKLGPHFLELQWWLQNKQREKGGDTVNRLKNFLSLNADGLKQLWFDEGRWTDILHEYFVPPANLDTFRVRLKEIQDRHPGLRTLNDTTRAVAADKESALPYAPVDSIASVLYYNQELSAEGGEKMTAFTREVIDMVHELGGKFYAPYRLDATQEQFERNFPGWRDFVDRKIHYDPDGLFSNAMFEHYRPKD